MRQSSAALVFPNGSEYASLAPNPKRQRALLLTRILYRAWPTPEENGNYIKTAMQNGPTKATVRNPARGDLFIARARPRFILFFSGAVAEGIAVLRKIWPAPASEPRRRTAPLKNKENDSMAQVTINRSPLRGLSGQLDIRVRSSDSWRQRFLIVIDCY